MSETHYIVAFDDGDTLILPMGWDGDCEGALCASSRCEPIAIFKSRKQARQAIVISSQFARLCKAQGKPVNTDFTDSLKNVRIMKCVPEKSS